MITIPRWMNVSALALLASGVLASCTAIRSSPQAVQSSNPRVTYNYRTDQELVQANQSATTYCNQFQTVPRSTTITNNVDGSKAVVFECVKTTSTVSSPPPAPPSQSYTYRTDQELVQASQAAGVYCQRMGSQPLGPSIVTNTDGSRTVTFQCGAR